MNDDAAQRTTLEKVASMEDVNEVLDALTQYFERVPKVIPLFFETQVGVCGWGLWLCGFAANFPAKFSR